jgi:hypothetical protein
MHGEHCRLVPDGEEYRPRRIGFGGSTDGRDESAPSATGPLADGTTQPQRYSGTTTQAVGEPVREAMGWKRETV